MLTNDEDDVLTLENSVLYIYEAAELPVDLLTCVAVNNDVSEDSHGSRIDELAVPASGVVTIVVSAQNDFHLGTYRLKLGEI